VEGNTRDQGAETGWLQFGQNIYSDKYLLILFNSAIKNIENAVIAIEDNNFNRAHIQVIVAQEMIAKWALSFPGDSLEAKRIMQIHDYLQGKLSDANIKKDTGLLKAIMNLMIIISETYCHDKEPSIFSSLSNFPLTKVFSETG